MVDQYHSVAFTVGGMAPAYVFRLRDVSPTGMGVAVKEGSDLLDKIGTGTVLDVEYCSAQRSGRDLFRTEIEHITRHTEGRYSGHFIIGLSVVEPVQAAS